MNILDVEAQEILDSRGNPTVEAEVILDNGIRATASVPSGASTGSHEALELRDKDERYGGKGVQKAVNHVNEVIAFALRGKDILNQKDIDAILLETDNSDNKEHLGANAILAVSMAVVKAASASLQLPLYRYVARLFGNGEDTFTMPVPMMNVLNGGKHAVNSADIQEFMLVPVGAPSIQEAVRWGSEIFHTLGKMLEKQGFQTTVGDEGGYAPSLGSNEKPLELIVEAIQTAGYLPGQQVAIALDPAASSFYSNGNYVLKAENKTLSSEQLIERYEQWCSTYPIVSIEDGLMEDDWQGFSTLTARLGKRIQIVGDDLFVTNPLRLQKGIQEKAANAILIKLNQIGTVSETIEAMQLAKHAGMSAIVSHRSGETEDTFIADFVVGAGTGQIKTGSLSRSERVAKYNRLMEIERELGEKATYGKVGLHFEL